jgi:hypothetical protein
MQLDITDKDIAGGAPIMEKPKEVVREPIREIVQDHNDAKKGKFYIKCLDPPKNNLFGAKK